MNVIPQDRAGRVCVGDSWFASVDTVTACTEALGVRFIGNVKTATQKMPVAAMKHTLAPTNRGDVVVMHCEELNMRAIGWNDHYLKTYISNAYTTCQGLPSKKKRQCDDGANYQIDVRHPKVI